MNPAFAYIYDDFLSDRRFERELANLETELARRGIQGRAVRLAMFRSAQETAADMAASGVKNIVIVGNDKTLGKMMWFLPDLHVTMGYIPLVEPSATGSLLGIPVGLAAVDILAARLVEILDVGKIDDRYFLTEVTLPATVAALDVEGRYRISPAVGGAIAIRNLGGSIDKSGQGSFANPQDGWLEAVIQTRAESKRFLKSSPLKETYVRFQHGSIISKEPMDVFVDGHVVNGFTFRLSILPAKLKMITGRDRSWQLGTTAEASPASLVR